MSENYRAWRINLNDFYQQRTNEDRLKFLIRFAVLAPSSHNSQPWRFHLAKNAVVIVPETRRMLPESDQNNRQLSISLGCAMENIVVAADYFGFQTAVSLTAENERATRVRVTLTYSPLTTLPPKKHLIFSIQTRSTNRNPYKSTTPAPEFLTWLHALQDNRVEIHTISEKTQREIIADIVIAAGIAAMENVNFRKELSHYIRPNITRSKVGMPGFGFGIPTPISLLAPLLIRSFNMNKITKKHDELLLKKHTPFFIVISTVEDSPASSIQAGRLYERIALEAVRHGMSTAPMAAPIEIGEFYQDFQDFLRTSFRPQVFCRVGYAEKSPPHSPRLPAAETIV